MKVGFTGTQVGMTAKQKRIFVRLLQKLKPQEFHHGDCIGADEDAHMVVKCLGLLVAIHPPTKSAKRAYCDIGPSDKMFEELSYLERNHVIVDMTDFLIATPKETTEQLRSGTWATIRYAQKKKKKVVIIAP